MSDAAVTLLEGQLETAKAELEQYSQALTVRRKTLSRTMMTVRATKMFIKHCQRTGMPTKDAFEFYMLALQRHQDHEGRRDMLKNLVSQRHETAYVLTSALERLRSK